MTEEERHLSNKTMKDIDEKKKAAGDRNKTWEGSGWETIKEELKKEVGALQYVRRLSVAVFQRCRLGGNGNGGEKAKGDRRS